MRFCVYQGITTLINSAYQNRGHAQVVATNLKQKRMYNLTMSCASSFYWLHLAILAIMATTLVWPTGKTSDEITKKTRNKMRQVRTHTWASGTCPKLKSLQDLSITVNPEVTEEVMHDAGLWVDGGLHLYLYVCKFIHPSLESSDLFHCTLNLVSPITDVPFQRNVPVGVPSRGRDFGSKARHRVTVRRL
jgi:hypothetical protein